MPNDAEAYIYDGQNWVSISGRSIEVSGPQPVQPPNPKKGDVWLDDGSHTGAGVIGIHSGSSTHP
jgi:hypothetical protein